MSRTPLWLRPRWVAGHVICVLLIVLFVNLGFWQLRRLDEKRDRNDLVASRERAPAATVGEVLAQGADRAQYRLVRDHGRWDDAETVLIRSRALDERSGYDVVTPLVLDDGTVVAVNRGFAPFGRGGEPAIVRASKPVSPEVEVRGILRDSEERGRFGPKDQPGRQPVLNRIDLRVLQRQSDHRLAPLYLQLLSSQPDQPVVPIPRPLPHFDEGPHLSYAVQWFIFATVGAIGWPLLLRKRMREADESGQEAAETGSG